MKCGMFIKMKKNTESELVDFAVIETELGNERMLLIIQKHVTKLGLASEQKKGKQIDYFYLKTYNL